MSGARRFFEAVERRFGRLSSLHEPRAGVIETAGRLEPEHLRALLAHEVSAIHARGWFAPAAAAALAESVLHPDASSREWMASAVGRRGLESTDARARRGSFSVHSGMTLRGPVFSRTRAGAAVGGTPFSLVAADPAAREEYFAARSPRSASCARARRLWRPWRAGRRGG